MRILVVEDDEVIREELTLALAREGVQVESAAEGKSGLLKALERSWAVIVLDIMLPGMDGVEICRRLRKADRSDPILMLTAKDSIEDRVAGLEAGADDYLVKPFDVRELRARIGALRRREDLRKSNRLEVDTLVIDTGAKTVHQAGKELHLTPREFSLLEALARNLGRTLTRDLILESVWNNEESLPGVVNFHLSSLRRKLEEGGQRRLIHTIHGFGYVMRSPD